MGWAAARIERLLKKIDDDRAKQLIEEKQKLKTETPMIDDARAKQLIEESAESLNQKNAYTLGKRKLQEEATPYIEAYRTHEEKYLIKAVESLLSEAIDKEDIRLVVIAREALKALRQKPKTDLNFSKIWDPELKAVDWTK
jgi:hypothetical protein